MKDHKWAHLQQFFREFRRHKAGQRLFAVSVLFLSSNTFAQSECTKSLNVFLKSRVEILSSNQIQKVELNLAAPNAKALRELAEKKIKILTYVVDPENHVYFTQDVLSDLRSRVVVASAPDSSYQVPIKEAGLVEYDAGKKTYQLRPTFEPIDLTEEEMKLIRESASSKDFTVAHSLEGKSRTRVMDCKKIYEAQRRGDSFIWDQFLTSNALTTLSIAGSNPGRFTDAKNYDLLLSDFVTVNEHVAIRSFSGKVIMTNGMTYPKRLGTRVGVGMFSTEVQNWTTQAIVNDKDGRSAKERAGSLTDFNRLWMIPSLLKSDAMDTFILKKLPDLAYNLCLDGSPLRIIASPKVVRFAEGWLSSVLYFNLRDQYMGESK